MSQKAAVIADSPVKGSLTKVTTIPIHEPNENQILIKTVAFAANPTDWKHIEFKQGGPGDIAGSDASGIVEKIGSKVTGFKKGDFVSTFSHGNFSKIRGNFAEYIIADPSTTIKYDSLKSDVLSVGDHKPSKIDTFEGAASITLGLVTVALSFAGNLRISSEDRGKYILIWGGATATGVLAIQLAKLAFGLKVVTTASPKHNEFLKSIGADLIFNYNDSDVTEQIAKATNGDIKYAFDTVSDKSTFQQLYDSFKSAKGPVKVDSLLFLTENDITLDPSFTKNFEIVNHTLAYVANGDHLKVFGVDTKADDELLERYNTFWTNEVVPKIVPQLIHTSLKVLPSGFESTNEAFDLLQSNKVSGEKVVFRA
ncbi:hypothetical protein WICMUC_004955 [Wickerhamomyces mucosus]|uniref:Enoyl reductase (ER) domain-containing protein n=1 Tax=Wickerhamomyces mucosus TaxID=1378264 RepID=A0A9P8PC36_9ASCO|nr:hypothetical protein WICMUC_004955 [Wickerhamomyces mucosus]